MANTNDSYSLIKELEMSGLETDGKLPTHMMTTTTTTINKQTEPKKLNSSKQFVNIVKKAGHVIKECRQHICKEQE